MKMPARTKADQVELVLPVSLDLVISSQEHRLSPEF